MVRLAATFRKQFSHWGISLPEQDAQNRSPGVIHQAGWTIRYHFGVEDGRQYLEYFAGHRMTNDRLVRICEDGSSETLDACQGSIQPLPALKGERRCHHSQGKWCSSPGCGDNAFLL